MLSIITVHPSPSHEVAVCSHMVLMVRTGDNMSDTEKKKKHHVFLMRQTPTVDSHLAHEEFFFSFFLSGILFVCCP